MKQSTEILAQYQNQIVKYDAMCHAIQECHKIDEVKNIRDKALACQVYAAQALNTDAERKACEIRLRAEKRAGQLLKDMEASGERHTTKNNSRGGRLLKSPTLEDLGISRDQSSKWQALANVPEDEFEEALKSSKMPSTAGIIAVNQKAPQMDKDALWVWGRLRDFERDRICDRNPFDLLENMTETMQADVFRISPIVCEWLHKLSGE